jgi:hypothetical protein
MARRSSHGPPLPSLFSLFSHIFPPSRQVHLVKGSLHFTADGEAASRLHLQFFIDAATPVAVLVLYCASPVNDGELLSCVSTPVAYSTTRVVLPAGSHQLFNQKDTGDALDLALFPDPLLFEGHDVPWSSRSSFPVMVVLESVGEAEVGSRTTVDMVPGPGLDMRPKRGAKLQITLASLTPPKAGGLPGVHLLAQKLQVRCGWGTVRASHHPPTTPLTPHPLTPSRSPPLPVLLPVSCIASSSPMYCPVHLFPLPHTPPTHTPLFHLAQILGHSFCVEEIYGLASQSPPSSGAAPAAAVSGGSTAAADNLDDGSAECVICLSQRRDTVCFPCRYFIDTKKRTKCCLVGGQRKGRVLSVAVCLRPLQLPGILSLNLSPLCPLPPCQALVLVQRVCQHLQVTIEQVSDLPSSYVPPPLLFAWVWSRL